MICNFYVNSAKFVITCVIFYNNNDDDVYICFVAFVGLPT